jgi:hypothetical protein
MNWNVIVALKMKEILQRTFTWLKPENIMFSKISYSLKDKNYIISPTETKKKEQCDYQGLCG